MPRIKTLVGSLLVLASPLQADPVTLKEGIMVDKVYDYSMTMSQVTTAKDVGDITMNVIVNFNGTVTQGKAPGTKRMNCKYTRLAVKMKIPNLDEIDLDSDHPEKPANDELAKIKDASFDLILGANGELLDVENIVNPLKEHPSFGKMFTKAELMKMGDITLKGLPKKPISIGDDWDFSNKAETDQIGEVRVKGKYTYEGTKAIGGAECLQLKVGGTLAAGGGEDHPDITILNGVMNGTTYFDNAIGTIRRMELATRMDIEMKDPAGNVTRMPTRQKTVLELKSVKDAKDPVKP